MRTETKEIFRYEGRKRIKDFIAIVRDGKIIQFKKFTDVNRAENGYILPRAIDENNLEDYFDKCSSCGAFFPDRLNPCEECDEFFCCDCAEEHRQELMDNMSTGGCNY